MNDLPDGWTKTTLRDLLVLKYGKALKKSNRLGGNVAVYGSNGEVGRHSEAITSGPTIVVGRKGSIGEVHFSPKPCFPIDTTYYVDEFPSTSPYFAIEILKQLRLTEMNRATAIPGLNRNDAYERLCLLPPLAEQKRIVEKLDSLTTSSREAAAALSNVEALIEQYRAAVLDTVFKKIAKFPTTALKSITSKIGSGATPRGGKSVYLTEGVRLIRSQNVHFGGFTNKGLAFISDEHADKLKNVIVSASDVLLNITGASIGRVCIAGIANEGARVNQHVAIIRLNDDFEPKFIEFFLSSPKIQDWIWSANYGVTRQALTKTMIEDLEVPNIPRQLQSEFVDKVEGAFSQIDVIEASLGNARSRLEALERAMLDRAFKGKLVPQDPSDEPASVLMERIKTDKKTTVAKAGGPKAVKTEIRIIPKMSVNEQIEKAVTEGPTNGTTFEELNQLISGSYDEVKDAVFEMLSGSKPKLKQKFDDESKIMRLLKA